MKVSQTMIVSRCTTAACFQHPPHCVRIDDPRATISDWSEYIEYGNQVRVPALCALTTEMSTEVAAPDDSLPLC